VLRDINLQVPRGGITAVLGPSGSGKSTLLAALTGERAPAAGSVEVLGQPVPQGKRALLELRKGIGMLLQGNGLLTDLTAAENVALPLRAHTDLPGAVIRPMVLMKLHAVGLRGAARLKPQQLSGGMGRRVALARAIVMDPQLLLYDEPLSGLGPASGVVEPSAPQRHLGQSSFVTYHVTRCRCRPATRS
jgi:phospholipid/cholesterol/gamma-HCH transport system ATP-binding protein